MIVLSRLGACSLLLAAVTSLSAVFVVLLPALQLRKEPELPHTASHHIYVAKAKPMPMAAVPGERSEGQELRHDKQVADAEASSEGRLLKPKPKPKPQPEVAEDEPGEARLLKPKPKPKPATFPENSEGLIEDALLHRSKAFRQFVDERVFLGRTLHLLK